VVDLCARHHLGADQAGQLQALLAVLAGDRNAPTPLRDPRRALDDHLADSLVALDLASVRRARAIADLGSGAGFPGLPLAIAVPSAEVFLVESNGRKCEFLAGAISSCHAANAVVVNDRAETWAAGLGRCDLVVARALAPLAVVAEYAAPLLLEGGVLVAWRGRRDPDDDRAGEAAAEVLGLQYSDPIRVQPFPGALHRHLQVLFKVAETPDRFPRRPGVARKRPLGDS
jgi:16S rRNA (guanine527-N7)-methyltransferase